MQKNLKGRLAGRGGAAASGQFQDFDEQMMARAISLARNGLGRTSPNPLVGAVIVRDGRIVAEGWHRKAGTPHAEIHALNMAGELARGATVYVSLEPCAHYGRTGPCAKALVEAGVSRVVVAMMDPNPKVAGKGIAILQEAGIQVTTGVLEQEARQLNEVFLKWMTTGLPGGRWICFTRKEKQELETTRIWTYKYIPA